MMLLSGSTPAQEASVTSYAIDNEKSWIRVLVYRTGMLSGLGHNHVISSHDVEGFIECADPLTDSLANLKFSAESLVVDDQKLRTLEGKDFFSKPSARDIKRTRKNMLGRKLLDAENFEEIVIQTTRLSGEPEALRVAANVIIGDRENPVEFVATAEFSGNQLIVTGTAELSHKDLGLKTFSAALGMIKVHENMTIRFFLVAKPVAERK